jgi:N-acetylmuramoyl-L-alanine amidase
MALLATLVPVITAVEADAARKRPASIQDVRHSVQRQRTRVVIDLSRRASYEVVRFERPERIAVNVPNAKAMSKIRSFKVPSGVVHRVRINRLSWGSQVVLDLRKGVTWNDFFLDRVDGLPDRIVLDVVPKRTSVASAATASTAVPAPANGEAAPPRRYVVAVDAGHGGSDPGAIGHRLVEKRIALDIARRVARDINARAGFRAVLIRDRDVFLTLPKRTQIALAKGADVFVSVHLNSAKRRSARGAEVFFLSPAGAEATASKFLSNKRKAAKELGLKGSKNEDLLYMVVNINQQSMMQRSSLLAEEILRHQRRKGLPPARSVKQRAFAVLKSISMPSVIVETGFLTNSRDAAILKSEEGKERIAAAIASGTVSYLKKYPPPSKPGREIVVHKVGKGDTLWKISRLYNTTVGRIQRANNLGNSKTIRVGQEIVIHHDHDVR